jgi:eukaryotic-like serine/threonine-protein kinase
MASQSSDDTNTLRFLCPSNNQPRDESTIGHFHVLRKISEGGMGVVYLAERNDAEYKQKVAIKLVKLGMDNEFVLRRFRDERQILASLDHSYIAKLHDGGTQDGRPYLVMDHIDGDPITEYADKKKLSIAQRLRLFQMVCQAVHYAHQKLVIHRDIKPRNILVTKDGRPTLLDFGIAKLLSPEIVGHPLENTAVGFQVMTPEYASPEQVRREEITTTSDVYSLGVLLYELLTGHPPYQFGDYSQKEIERVVCTDQPKPLSIVVGVTESYFSRESNNHVNLTPEGVSSTRDSSPDKLRRQLTGDLDNIVLKAMHKDPERRYTSVDQFASDIARHLQGHTVIARKDTLVYRGSKFLNRHQTAAAAVIVVLVSLILATFLTLQQHFRAERQSEKVRQLVASFLQYNDAIKDLPGSAPIRAKTAKYLVTELDNLAREVSQSERLLGELATAYEQVGDSHGNPFENNVGDRDSALDSYRKALAIREELVRQDPYNVEERRALAVTHLRVGQVLFANGYTQDAEEALKTGLTILHELFEKNQLDSITSRALPNAYRTLGYALSRRGDAKAAMVAMRKGQAVFNQLVTIYPSNQEVLYDLNTINRATGEAQIDLGDFTGGLESLRVVLQVDQGFVSANPTNLVYKTALATDYWKIGNAEIFVPDVKGAVQSFRQMFAITKEVAESDRLNRKAQNLHAIAQVRLGRTLYLLGEYDEGLTYLQSAALFFRKIAEENPESPYAQIQMAYTDAQVSLALAKTGRDEESVLLGTKAYTTAEKQAAGDPSSVEFRNLLAGIYSMYGDVHATLTAGKRYVDAQITHLHSAIYWYRRSYDLLKQLKDQGQSTDVEYGTPDELLAKIATCNSSLYKLESFSKEKNLARGGSRSTRSERNVVRNQKGLTPRRSRSRTTGNEHNGVRNQKGLTLQRPDPRTTKNERNVIRNQRVLTPQRGVSH